MATYSQARSARDAAFELVTRKGGTVLQVAPMRRGDDWLVEVETASPLPPGADKGLSHEGVRIVVRDCGLTPLTKRIARPG